VQHLTLPDRGANYFQFVRTKKLSFVRTICGRIRGAGEAIQFTGNNQTGFAGAYWDYSRNWFCLCKMRSQPVEKLNRVMLSQRK
jgi:hypothetical protein